VNTGNLTWSVAAVDSTTNIYGLTIVTDPSRPSTDAILTVNYDHPVRGRVIVAASNRLGGTDSGIIDMDIAPTPI
jgi:hypothetical protein